MYTYMDVQSVYLVDIYVVGIIG